MGMFAWLFGFIGVGCMGVGILTALGEISLLHEEFTWTFWFVLAALMLLISIAFAIGSSKRVE